MSTILPDLNITGPAPQRGAANNNRQGNDDSFRQLFSSTQAKTEKSALSRSTEDKNTDFNDKLKKFADFIKDNKSETNPLEAVDAEINELATLLVDLKESLKLVNFPQFNLSEAEEILSELVTPNFSLEQLNSLLQKNSDSLAEGLEVKIASLLEEKGYDPNRVFSRVQQLSESGVQGEIEENSLLSDEGLFDLIDKNNKSLTNAKLHDQSDEHLLESLKQLFDEKISRLKSENDLGLVKTEVTMPAHLINAADKSLTTIMPHQLTSTATTQDKQAWSEEIGNKLIWLVSNNMKSASIKLNPPELGNLDLKIQINNQNVNINFNSQYGAVREILEESLPQLKEMLSNNGMNLAEVDISNGKSQQDRAETQLEEQTYPGQNEEEKQDSMAEQEFNEKEMSIDPDASLVNLIV